MVESHHEDNLMNKNETDWNLRMPQTTIPKSSQSENQVTKQKTKNWNSNRPLSSDIIGSKKQTTGFLQNSEWTENLEFYANQIMVMIKLEAFKTREDYTMDLPRMPFSGWWGSVASPLDKGGNQEKTQELGPKRAWEEAKGNPRRPVTFPGCRWCSEQPA